MMTDGLGSAGILRFSYWRKSLNVNPDMLGQAYEYLIKHFADLRNEHEITWQVVVAMR